MKLISFSLLAFFVFISAHVLALNYDQEVVTQAKKINKPTVLLTKEKVPMRRSTIGSDVRRVNSRSTFKNKQDSFHRKPHLPDGKTERAMAHYRTTMKIDGVKARINVWQPSVDREKAYSSSQIWIVSDEDDENQNVIEVGCHVFPRRYGDNKTRLFIHWTTWRDDQESGCYNLDCLGFVNNASVNMIGEPFETVSVYGGLQRFITVQVKREEGRRHWSLLVDNTRVGYWPNHIFTHLSEGAIGVFWGGETWIMNTDDDDDDEDILAQMGSGRYAQQGYRRASCFNKLAVAFDSLQNGEFIDVKPDNLALIYTSPGYNITAENEIDGVTDNSGFFYGGPGTSTT